MNRRPTDGALLSVAATAALLGVTERSIRARVARHIIPFRRLGAKIVFVRTELEQFITALPGVSLQEAKSNLSARAGEVAR